MEMDKNDSWKEKIDPAFDEIIKVYLYFIENTCICTGDKKKRYLSLDNESLKVLERKRYPHLSKEYKQNPSNLKKFTNDIITLGASPDTMHISGFFKNMAKLFNKNEKKKSKRENKNEHSDVLDTNIMSMIKGLSREDSRNYYKNRFETLPEKVKTFVEGKNQKEINKVFFDLGVDVSCLMHQTGIRGYWDSQDKSYGDKKINKVHLVNTGMQQMYNAISIMTYKKSLGQLIEEARNNDESLYNALHLDKTLFDVDWVRKRIRKAFYSGDSAFFKQLGRAIKKPPIPAKLMYGEAIIILALLWFLGLCRLNNAELMELLKVSGVMIPEDSESFRKFIDRLKDDKVIKDFNKIINEL